MTLEVKLFLDFKIQLKSIKYILFPDCLKEKPYSGSYNAKITKMTGKG